jgi:AcrR family transcriptional regulator
MNKTERIIKAARERFRYYGLAKTSMQEIARDAGVAVGTLYLYFANKDELVAACAEEFADQHRKKGAAILASQDPADVKLRKYVIDRFRQSARTRTGSRHMAEITRAVLRVKPQRVEEEGMMMWDFIRRILGQGIEAGLFAIGDVDADAKVFVMAIAYVFPNALSIPPIPARQEDLLTVTDWFIAAWKRGLSEAAVKRTPKARAVSV